MLKKSEILAMFFFIFQLLIMSEYLIFTGFLLMLVMIGMTHLMTGSCFLKFSNIVNSTQYWTYYVYSLNLTQCECQYKQSKFQLVENAMELSLSEGGKPEYRQKNCQTKSD